jgi:hypothetical protein
LPLLPLLTLGSNILLTMFSVSQSVSQSVCLSVCLSVFCRYYERWSKHIVICKKPTSSTRAEHLQRTRLRPPK